jgi:hypothetical protein
VAFLRFSRDKRGYENYYLVQPTNRRGKARPRLLYWFRTPPNVKVGREPFDPELRLALEKQNPDVRFDWVSIVETPIPPVVDTERWRERRRQERAIRQEVAAEAQEAESQGADAQNADAQETGAQENSPPEQAAASSTEPAQVGAATVVPVDDAGTAVEAISTSNSSTFPTVAGQEPARGRRRRRRRGRRGQPRPSGPGSGPEALDGGSEVTMDGATDVTMDGATDVTMDVTTDGALDGIAPGHSPTGSAAAEDEGGPPEE